MQELIKTGLNKIYQENETCINVVWELQRWEGGRGQDKWGKKKKGIKKVTEYPAELLSNYDLFNIKSIFVSLFKITDQRKWTWFCYTYFSAVGGSIHHKFGIAICQKNKKNPRFSLLMSMCPFGNC